MCSWRLTRTRLIAFTRAPSPAFVNMKVRAAHSPSGEGHERDNPNQAHAATANVISHSCLGSVAAAVAVVEVVAVVVVVVMAVAMPVVIAVAVAVAADLDLALAL